MLQFLSKILISWSLVYQPVFACDKPVTYSQKMQPAPCTGYLFTPEKELEVRTRVQKLKLLEDTVEIKNKQLKLYRSRTELLEDILKKETERTELWRKKAVDSTEKYMESESGRGTRDLLFLVSGILLTVGAGWAVGQASK